MSRHVHHLALARDWSAALASSTHDYRVSTAGRSLEEEGFIHASFADQVDAVAGRYFRDVAEPLVLLTIDVGRLSCEVRLEAAGDDAYPHLYGPLPVEAVVAVAPYEVPPVEAAVARFHHAHLFASDLPATLAFYRRWFGARMVADEVLLGSRNVMVALGDGRLNLYDQPPPPPAGRSAVHHLGLQVRDLPALVERMAAGGVPFRRAVREGEGFRYVMAEAPDGVLLELFETRPDAMPPAAFPWFAWP